MSLSVSIDRTELSLAALVIHDHPDDGTGLWIPEDGNGRPAKTWTRTTVTSPFQHGTVTTRATLEQSSIPFTVYAKAASAAALEALQDELEAALFQFVYDVTITEGGQARTFECDPADVSWFADSSMTRAFLSRATVTIPCYPVGA